MLKNKKGFSLIELMTALIIIGILLSVALPSYKISVLEAKIVNNLPLLKAMQVSMLDYYNLHNSLPNQITQLSMNTGEFSDISSAQATHTTTRCVFTMNNSQTSPSVSMDCNEGWNMRFQLEPSALGYTYGERRFNVTGGGSDAERLHKVAKTLGWQRHGDGHYTIQ